MNEENPKSDSLSERIRILLVDDAIIVRESLSTLLNRQEDMQVVAEAGNGQEAIEHYRLYRPDLILMDVSMPRMDGITATAAILEEFPAACIVIFSSMDGDEYRSLQAGAKAYLLKEAPRQELYAVIRQANTAAKKAA